MATGEADASAPPPSTPARLAAALGANPLRLRVLQRVIARPATASNVMSLLGLSRNGARNHLRALEREGLLVTSIVKHHTWRTIVWSADRDEVMGLIDDLDQYLLSGEDGVTA